MTAQYASFMLAMLFFLSCIVQQGQTLSFRKSPLAGPFSMSLSKKKTAASPSSVWMLPKSSPRTSFLPQLPLVLSPVSLLPKVRVSTALRVLQLFRNSPSSADVSSSLNDQLYGVSQATAQLATMAGLYKLASLNKNTVTRASPSSSTTPTTGSRRRAIANFLQIPLEVLLLGRTGGHDALRIFKGLTEANFARDLSGWARLMTERPFTTGDVISVALGTKDVTGRVLHIGLKGTQIEASPQTVHFVPNHHFSQAILKVSKLPIFTGQEEKSDANSE